VQEHNFNNEDERDLVSYELQEKKNRQDLDRRIDIFAVEDPKIYELILRTAPEFLSNPREIKRFMNVFRLQYFLLLARQTRGFITPSMDQLSRWIILSLKWPDLVRWLQWSGERKVNKSAYGKNTTLTGYRLMQLEDIGRRSDNQYEWQNRAETDLQLGTEIAPWIIDEDVMKFFKREGNMPPNERLSTSAGRGLY
jgi:hypothetical protein